MKQPWKNKKELNDSKGSGHWPLDGVPIKKMEVNHVRKKV